LKKKKQDKKAPKRPRTPSAESKEQAQIENDSEIMSVPTPADSALVKYDPLQRYLQELGQYELLSREEEKELAIRVREEGDRDAAYRLVTSNLRLVVKIAMDFQRVWMQNLLDLIQEGNIGLMQAVQKFDPYKGVKFSYYASFWIKAYILKFIMDNWRLVKIGTTQAQRKLFFRLKKEKQKLASEGFDPKPKLLSERLGVSEQEVTEMDQRLDRWEVSLDSPVKEGSDNERIDFVPTQIPSAEVQVGNKQMGAIIHEKLASLKEELSEREIYILENRVFSDTPVTLQEIGERYNITRERVRQIENGMIKKMKAHFQREIPDFESFLSELE
jgi:RNA polymerase sigma-32 factor